MDVLIIVVYCEKTHIYLFYVKTIVLNIHIVTHDKE